MSAQFCPYCGSSLMGIDAAFCPRCGHQLPADASDGTAPGEPPLPPPSSFAPPPPTPPYAAPSAYSPAPYAAAIAPHYVPPAPVGPLTPGRAIGVTAVVAALPFVVYLLLPVVPAYRLTLQNSSYTVVAILPWVLAGAFWLAVGRLARYSLVRVASECAVLAFAGLLLLPVLDALLIRLLLGFGSPGDALYWLRPNPPSKYVIILVVSALVALGAAGLAWGFAGWTRVRAAHGFAEPLAPMVPVGVMAGFFVLTDGLFFVLAYRLRVIPFYALESSLALTVIFQVLPVVAIAVLGGAVTYNVLRARTTTPPAALR